MEELGGQIQIVSRTGGGTKVRLLIPPVSQTVILIESELQTAQRWLAAAQKHRIDLRHYSSSAAFLAESTDFSLQVPIYLNIGSIEDSEIGQKLREFGYSEIFLCSGKDLRELTKYRWAKGICGKEPPWL